MFICVFACKCVCVCVFPVIHMNGKTEDSLCQARYQADFLCFQTVVILLMTL